MLEERHLVDFVREHTGIESDEDAERAISATTTALAEALTTDEATALARDLPERLAKGVLSAQHGAPFDLDAFYERVAHREGAPTGVGLEHAQAVCGALASSIDPETRLRLQKHLGPAAAVLFDLPTRGRPPSRAPVVAPAAPRSTLAEGRPGGVHPLSESGPSGVQAGSVAESNPHADSKLSSAHGLTQEALKESLATGRPGPQRHGL